jgi:hypothetical protein
MEYILTLIILQLPVPGTLMRLGNKGGLIFATGNFGNQIQKGGWVGGSFVEGGNKPYLINKSDFRKKNISKKLYAMNLLERGPLKLKFHSRTPGRAPRQYDNKIVV